MDDSPFTPDSQLSSSFSLRAKDILSYIKSGEEEIEETKSKEEASSLFVHNLLLALHNCPSSHHLSPDLIQLISSPQHPLKVLSTLIQLKKQGAEDTRGALLGKGLQLWISRDSLARILVPLSLREQEDTESVLLLHPLLFSIPQCFNVPPASFLSYLLTQVALSISTLAARVREGYEGAIRTTTLATTLERLFIRYHEDGAQFGEGKGSPFSYFIQHQLVELGREDFIQRRLLTKVLLGLGPYASFKFARTLFLHDSGAVVLFPSDTFLQHTTWKNILCARLPQKTQSRCSKFWRNWAHFIYSSSQPQPVWEECVKNWESLCQSPAVDLHILIPATYAVIGLAREIKGQQRDGKQGDIKSILLGLGKIFESVGKCLDSTSEEKKACGMAFAQVLGDLHSLTQQGGKETLKFSSGNQVFQELVTFYEKGCREDEEEEKLSSSSELSGQGKLLVEVLDSDDEMEEEEEEKEDGNGLEEEEAPTNDVILSYRSRTGRLPSYFSEFVELFLEGGGQNRNEAEVETLKHYCVLKIPLLFSMGVRIDPNMAETLTKCLLDMDGGSSSGLEIPFLFSFYEIANQHPFQVFETFCKTAFDKDHYTSGQRMIVLQRMSQVIQLVSKTKCISCYKIKPKHRAELGPICPQFFKKYRGKRMCGSCGKTKSPQQQLQEEENDKEENATEALTWREIVDKRIESKTRRFVTPRRKTPVLIQDEYASKLVPLIWAPMANRVLSQWASFLELREREVWGASNDILLAQMFRVLGRILLGLGGNPLCPHLGNIATQVGELTRVYCSHPDAPVRQSLFALLAILLTLTSCAPHIVEAVCCGDNLFQLLQHLRDNEGDKDNQALLDHLAAFLTQAATIDYTLQFPSSSGSSSGSTNDIYSRLRVLQ